MNWHEKRRKSCEQEWRLTTEIWARGEMFHQSFVYFSLNQRTCVLMSVAQRQWVVTNDDVQASFAGDFNATLARIHFTFRRFFVHCYCVVATHVLFFFLRLTFDSINRHQVKHTNERTNEILLKAVWFSLFSIESRASRISRVFLLKKLKKLKSCFRVLLIFLAICTTILLCLINPSLIQVRLRAIDAIEHEAKSIPTSNRLPQFKFYLLDQQKTWKLHSRFAF